MTENDPILQQRAAEVREHLLNWHPGLAVELVEHIAEVIIDPSVDETSHPAQGTGERK